MNKNELEFEKARLSAEKFSEVTRLARHAFSVGALVGALYVIMRGLEGIVALQGPEGISAVASIIQAFDLGSVLGYVWGGGATLAWRMERNGKKRIISEKSRLQKKVEGADAYRSSSGLTDRGETPQEGS